MKVSGVIVALRTVITVNCLDVLSLARFFDTEVLVVKDKECDEAYSLEKVSQIHAHELFEMLSFFAHGRSPEIIEEPDEVAELK